MANLSRKVTLALSGNITDIASKLNWVSGAIDDTKKAAKNIPITGDDKGISRTLSEARAKVAELAEEAKNIPLDLNDKEAVAKYTAWEARLNALSEKVASPRLNLRGFDKAVAETAALSAGLEKIGNMNVSPKVNPSGGGGGGFFSFLPSVESLIPWAIGIGAALAPFLGQALGGGLVLALGGGLAAVGAASALKLAPVQKSLHNLVAVAKTDFDSLGPTFSGVMTSVFNAAQGTLVNLMPAITNSLQRIAGPVKQFATTLVTALGSPAVSAAITQTAKAFGSVLTALSPSLPGIINSVANAVTALSNNIAKNPQAIAFFVRSLVDIAVYAINAINALTVAANFIEGHFNPVVRSIGAGFITVIAISLGAIRELYIGAMTALGGILNKLAQTFGFIPGYGSKLRQAANDFNTFKDNSVKSLNGTISSLNDLAQAIDTIPTKRYVSIEARGLGSFTVTGSVSTGYINTSTSASGVVHAYSAKAAATGWMVPGSGNGDTVPAWLTPGEAVVPKRLVPAVAPFLAANNVPGFASGGIAGLANSVGSWYTGLNSRFISSMETAMTPHFARGGMVRSGGPIGPVLAMAGGGDTYYTVNVNASPLAHPADVGREVVNSIKSFERGSGSGWRS